MWRAVWAMSLLVACQPPVDDDPAGAPAAWQDELSSARFPATLHLPGCTAAKIGRRQLLTAAHCVLDEAAMALGAQYRAGAALALYSGPDLALSTPIGLLVTGTVVHPSYADAVLRADGAGVARADYDRVVDLAVVTVDRDTPGVQAARIPGAAVLAGAAIVVGGYGERQSEPLVWGDGAQVRTLDGDDPATAGPTHRRRYRRAAVADVVGTVFRMHNGRWDDARGWVISNGFGAEQEQRLLPGDSGGPVYLDDAPPAEAQGAPPHAHLRIVGINSYSGLTHSAFVRLDPPGVGACIRSARDHAGASLCATGSGGAISCVPVCDVASQ